MQDCWPPKRFSLIVSLKSAKCVFVNLGEAVGSCPHFKLSQGLIWNTGKNLQSSYLILSTARWRPALKVCNGNGFTSAFSGIFANCDVISRSQETKMNDKYWRNVLNGKKLKNNFFFSSNFTKCWSKLIYYVPIWVSLVSCLFRHSGERTLVVGGLISVSEGIWWHTSFSRITHLLTGRSNSTTNYIYITTMTKYL